MPKRKCCDLNAPCPILDAFVCFYFECSVFKYILGLAAVVAGAMFFTGRLTLGQKKTSNVSAEDFDNDWLAGVPTNVSGSVIFAF